MRREGRGLRLLFCVLLFLFPAWLFAQNALVLIQHDQAGPNLPSSDAIWPEWILWPAEQAGWNNRILSLASGVDLQAEALDTRFTPFGAEGFRGANGPRLQARGFFAARRAYLGPVSVLPLSQPPRRVSPSVLLVAYDEPGTLIRTQPLEAALPTRGLLVVEAKDWDDVEAVARRAAGRTLVVEYPPDGEDGWSRFWTKGKGWPDGVPVERDLHVPGMVRGRSALGLLLRPETFDWRPIDAGRWGGPNRWLEHGQATTRGILLVWFAVGLVVLAWALAQVMNEDRGPFVSELLVLLALSPGALVLAGACAHAGGLEAWPFILAFCLFGLYALSWFVSLGARRWAPAAHPLWAPCAVGLACFVLGDPLWSDLSGRFAGLDLDVPGPALGAFVAYGTGVAAFAQGRWMGRAALGAALLWGVTARPWWADGHSALLVAPALALVAAEGLFRPVLLLVLALLPTDLLRIAREGVAWSPNGLHAFADDPKALNLWSSARLLLSPAWIGTLCVAAAGLLVGNRFLAYRLRKLLRLDPRLRALPWVAAGLFALGATEPLALPAVPVVAAGALIALAYDGLRANV